MKEKKVFILAIPTIIIIIVFIIGCCFIFYNRNIKKMSKDDAKHLAEKATSINNIYCKITTKGLTEEIHEYTLKDNTIISKHGHFIIYNNKEQNEYIQIDNNTKTAYVYSDNNNSEYNSFMERLCTVAKLFENEDYKYEFKEYKTENNKKCVRFTLSNTEGAFDILLDRKSGMIVKIECKYLSEGNESVVNNQIFEYEINNISDKDVEKPNLDGYNIVEM